MCWYPSAYPSPPGSKKFVCKTRSRRMKNWDPAMNGVARTTRVDVAKFAQTRSGMRQKDMPGARIGMMVTRKLSAVMLDEAHAHGPADAPPPRAPHAVRPAGCEGASLGGEEAREHDQPGDGKEPERERVQARERHVR